MLAYHLEWHLRQHLPPMLYDDADKAIAEALRTSVVAKAQRSPSAVAKQTHGTTPDGLPVHSLQTLLTDLATLARNTVPPPSVRLTSSSCTPVRLCSSKKRSISSP
jgi:hypothetical protein